MRRRWVVAVAILATACSSTTTATTATTTTTTTTSVVASSTVTSSTTTSTATTSSTVASPTSTSSPLPGALDALRAVVGHLNDGATDELFALHETDAVWSVDGLPLRLDEPLPAEMTFVAVAWGLERGAGGLDLIRAFVEFQAALGTEYVLDECVEQGGSGTCSYASSDRLAVVTGESQSGTMSVGVESNGLIGLLEIESQFVSDPEDRQEAYRRWSTVQDPDVARSAPTVAWAELAVELLDAWEAAGRPDLPVPDPDAAPIDVVVAYLDARNDGEWETHMALLAEDALDNEFGSRDEFEAAQALERRITVVDCSVELENEALGTFLACEVAVSDIIVEAAGVAPTNPNASTFRVRDGRVIDLPEFLPSLFIAEEAIEQWATGNRPDEYGIACPFGIAGQSVIDGLECARFIAAYQAEWAPVVAAAF